MYYPKDFIQTAEGLVFAVVAEGIEEEKILCFLRYRQTASGWQKLDTPDANALLADHTPDYRYYSLLKDTHCHAASIASVTHHFQPRQRLQQLLLQPTNDPVIQDLLCFVRLLQQHAIDISAIGVTGSLLIGAQQPSSDIDLVFYDRHIFQQTRQLVQELIAQQQLQTLNDEDWLEAYQRRGCEFSFSDYVWHEQRKANKVMINGRKVDLSLLIINVTIDETPFKKLGAVTRTFNVSDASLAYDYPAIFKVAADDVDYIVCFTATYTGQAIMDEWIEVAGQLEVAENGTRRIVVGASREAQGEYIKVIEPNA
ncbi:MAG: hypothetical protein NTV00_00665 [Methylococcales bacterium]|nr:hypothetical protein [Methylococcales bacterium]